jgi:hypothetical protein
MMLSQRSTDTFLSAEASLQGTSAATFDAGKQDPLKAVKGFARAPKKRGHDDEELTEMEVSTGWHFECLYRITE